MRNGHYKNIEGMFTALAIDIGAKEGKGIFCAKNKLGMSDRQIEQEEGKFHPIQIEIVDYAGSPKIANNESEIID
jgi:hypothetical protein